MDEMYDIFNEKNVVIIKENPQLENAIKVSDNKICGYFSMGGALKKQITFEKEGSKWKINLWDNAAEKIKKEEESNLDKKQFFEIFISNIEFKK